MSRSLRALVVGVCLVALPAAAQSAEVRKFLNAATALYENLEYEKALKQVARARQKAASAEDEVRVALLEGVVLADMGREEKALEAFKAAFSLELEAKLPLEVSPKVQAVSERARTAVRKVLAPALEQQRLEAEKKAEEERKAMEAKAREEEAQRARATAPPPPAAPPMTPGVTEPSRGGLRSVAWVPGAVGGAAALGAGWFLFSSYGAQRQLKEGSLAYPDALAIRTGGERDAMASGVLAAVAVAALATMGGFLVAGGPSTPTVAVAPLPGGGAVVGFSGVLDAEVR